MTVEKVREMPRKPLSGIEVLIVGGGLGGLAAAVECFRKGHDVTVLEAKPEIEGYGDFVGIGPSAYRQFQQWPEMAAIYESMLYRPSFCLYKCDGEFLGGPLEQGHGSLPPPVARPRLHRALYDYVTSLGIPVLFSKPVVDYYEMLEKNRAGVITEIGEHFEADLVVAADGIGTKSWLITTGEPTTPKSSGYAIYRTAFPTKIAFENPKVAKEFALPDNGKDIGRLYLGPNTHLIILVNKDITTWLLMHQDRNKATESWSNRMHPNEVIEEIAHIPTAWDPIALEVIKQSPKHSIVDWNLMWRNPNPQWTSPGGLVCQLGDAAHAFLPTSGSGATFAIEDGISLAACVELGGKSNVALATKVHEALRFQRVACGQRMGFKNREDWHHTDFKAAKLDPKKVMETIGRWVNDHNPEEYTYNNWSKCVNFLIRGTSFEPTNIPPGYEYKPWTIDELMNNANRGIFIKDAGDWN